MRQQSWREGWALDWLLDDGQREWVRAFLAGPAAAAVWMVSRQRGKSFAALAMACDECARAPGTIVRYAALTGKSARAIVLPTLEQVLATCPADMRPEVREQDGTVRWPNGSVLTWAGTDNEQFDRLRGPRAHLILLDESAFYADLERVESALLPQLTTTGGRVLYLSSPPESLSHPFVRRWHAALAVGRGVHSTVRDNPRLGPEGVARLEESEAARLGLTLDALRASTFWRREYLAELVAEESRAALPAWTRERAAELVGDWPRPAYFDGYSAIDLGKGGDPHAGLWGWYTPRDGLVIEAELELRSAAHTVPQWAQALKATERGLYGETAHAGTLAGAEDWLKGLADVPDWMRAIALGKARGQPYLRVGDPSEKLVLMTLSAEYGVGVLPSRADDKHMAVDAVNELVRTGRLRVHKRCVRLIEQMHGTTWNRTRSEWERTDTDHGDLVDCLVYMARNVAWHHDAAPPKPVDPYLREPTTQRSGWKGLV